MQSSPTSTIRPMNSISSFKGLNNVSDPLRLGLAWLVQADNVDITDTGALSKRGGYARVLTGAVTGAYSTLKFSRCYLVVGGTLAAFSGSSALTVLRTGLNPAPMHFAEVNDYVYFNNGVDSGVIGPDHSVQPWRDAPLKDALFFDAAGAKLDALFDPLPLGTDVVQHWRGRMYAAQYFSNDAQSAVWFSQPLGYHLFSMDVDFLMVPGRIVMLAPHADALIIGTDSQIHAFDGKTLVQLADYGVVPGQHWSRDDNDRILFWSKRGLCAGLPFANLTDRQVSVPPGVSAGGAIVRHGGQRRYVVSLQQGGTAFNPL